jgi:Immunoglobulin I-set domain
LAQSFWESRRSMSRANRSQLTHKIRFLLFVVLSGGLILAGCAGVTSTTGNPNGASVAPSITTQPVSASVTVGQTATFFVATTGTAPFSYQWQKNNTAISGGTSSTYTTPPTTASDNSALYKVVVGNSAGSATSNAATLNVAAAAAGAPSITTQPVSADVTVGQTATFSVAVTGTAPLSFQWQKNGTAVSGATSSSYTTPPTTAADNRALFTVVVGNSAGNITSNTATLNVAAAAGTAVQLNPNSATVSAGSTQQFAATVTGTSNTSVTWAVSGAGCSGVACGTISGGGLYTAPASVPSPPTLSVTVTSVADPTKSASASVTVLAAAAVLLSISPTSASVPAASTDSFTATVTGTTNTAVTWSVTGAGCSGSSCGTLATSLLSAVYQAPVVAPLPASVDVVATSMANPSKTASATVTIVSVVFVTVTPASTSLVTGATQQLSASVVGNSNTAVTWSVQGAGCSAAACGTVNGTGLYTAPSAVPSPSTVTVTATSAADPSKTGTASMAILSANATKTTTAYGLTFPNAHPRLFWTPSRTTIAQNWVTSTNYPGVTVDFRPLDYYDLAFTCFIMNNATACSTVIADAVAVSPQCSSGAGCDTMRGTGEWVMLVRDWLAPGCGRAQCLTTLQASTIDANWSILQANQDNAIQTWGNVGMPTSNYFAGQFRNDFDFGIASYIDNANADANLKYGIQDRWNDLLNYVSPIGTGKNGAKGYAMHNQEGVGEYGRYSLNYYAIPLASSALLGRDLWTETTAFKSGVLTTIYNTMLTQTTSRGMWDGFTSADDEAWVTGSGCGYISHNGPDGHGGCGMSSQNYGDFMQAAATEYNATNIGKYARQWISTVNPAIGSLFKSVDSGGTALAFSNLPLDYYSSGAQYMYLHDTWASTGTTMLWQMGLNQGGNPSPTLAIGTGHWHIDAGTFQASRKGVNIIRETMGYSETVAGYNSTGTTSAGGGLAHNVPLLGGQAGVIAQEYSDGPGIVKRLETQPNYAFAADDLTLTYQNNVVDSGNPSRENSFAVSVVREYYYFRAINTLVILDRLQTDTATRSTTFVSHCETSPTVVSATVKCIDGTQEALYTALLPAAPAITIVAENANGATAANWQYRIEANNSNPGNVVSYNIYTIQLGDASGFSALAPAIVDSTPGSPLSGTFTITLDANNSLILDKGIASTGGTIKAAGSTNALATAVQGMTITDSGPVWK